MVRTFIFQYISSFQLYLCNNRKLSVTDNTGTRIVKLKLQLHVNTEIP